MTSALLVGLLVGAPAVLPTNFCGDPINTICNVPGVSHAGRSILLSAELQRQRRTALAKIAKANGLDPKTLTEADLQRMPGTRGFSLRFDFALEILRAQDADRRAAEWKVVRENAEALRNMLLDAVDRRGKKSPRTFPPARIAAMKKALRDVVVLDMDGVIQVRNDAKNTFAATMGAGFERICGWDGMQINAFAARLPDPTNVKKRYLVICPGLVLSARGKGAFAWRSLPGVLGTVLHEFAHHIDYLGAPSVFGELETCVRKHHHLFLKPQPGEENLVSWMVMTPAQRQDLKTKRHMSEITADIWALEAYAPYLERVAASGRLDMLRMSFGGFCGTPDEGIHPDGDYRIGQLVRGDPAIARLMGCPAQQQVATTCSLDGTNTGALWMKK
ncbi:MAG: hypothetical protein RIT81_26230 [Deltaproteobacteria bacterium]